MRTLAERLIEAREEKGWKKSDLMRAAKLKSPSTLTELESGKRTESPQLPVIAEALGVEVIWLQHGRGHKTKKPTAKESERRLSAVSSVAFTPDEIALLDGFRLADDVTRRHMLRMAADSIQDFGKRSGENSL